MKSTNRKILVLLHSIHDFLQPVEYNTAIFWTKLFYISTDYNLLCGDVLIIEKQRNSVDTEKCGHEVNPEKSTLISMSWEENANENHNLNVIYVHLCRHND